VVAIKVVPAYWAGSLETRQRFDAEAQAIAKLSHPSICTLHDIGRQDDLDYFVMEYLEGETLAQRLERGALPVDDALKAGVAIGNALEKAHRQSVVHRDLKPSNVMMTPSGPKLLHFGLAQLKELEKNAAPATQPTTSEGQGTTLSSVIQYRAPEQLEGKATDSRTDIFSFGVLLYEMITGKKPFEGKNRAALIAAISTVEPDPPSKLQPMASPALDHVVQRCLAKDPEDRWQTAHDLMVQLQWIASGGVPTAVNAPGKREKLIRYVLLAAAILVAVMAVPAALYLRGTAEPNPFEFRIPVTGLSESDIAISPDGRSIALVARPNAQQPSSLFVRPTDSIVFRRLDGTDYAAQPFWAPDSRSIAYVTGGRLKRVEASGGAPKDLGAAEGFFGGTWSGEGTIVFGSAKGLQRVPGGGGNPEFVTTPDRAESGHYWPFFLPDGQHYLYLAWSAEPENRAVFAGMLGSKEKMRLISAESNVAYVPSGYLVFHREATLFAQPFNARKLVLTGEPAHIADQLAFNPATGRGNFDVSQKGELIYFQGRGGPAGRGQTIANASFGWLDRKGNQVAAVGEPGTYGDIDLSPDGNLIAITREEVGSDIWVIDWKRNVTTRLTRDPGDDINPVWSPDGRIAFTAFRKGSADIFVVNANGVGAETPLLNSSANEFVEDWSKDGRYIAYKFGQDGFEDIYALPLFGDKKPMPIVQGHFSKDEPQFSYDGKWLAYTSDESGTFQVYVISFPGGEQKLQISTDGGGQPRWRRDGKELYYRSADNGVMAVDIRAAARIEAGVPQRLFTASNSSASRDPIRHQWSVTPDGQRFLMRIAAGGGNRAAGPGARGLTPAAPTVFVPIGQPAPAGGGRGFVSFGLTFNRHWATALEKAGKR
jgi:serine/threonine protein kinase